MPLSVEQLESLAEREGERAEFKETLSDREAIKRAICAFSNDLADHRAPGVIFIGLRDDGTPTGLSITEELERTAAAFRSDGSLLPIPSVRVRRLQIRGADILALEVEPCSAPPMRLSGRVYVRCGSVNQRATKEEELRLTERVRWSALPFDQRAVPGATLADLDLRLFENSYLPGAVAREVLEANERSREQQLASLRLATPSGQPTYAGVLVLGINPREWVPGAYVQFLRVDGRELTDEVRDRKEIDGNLIDVVRRLDEVLELNVQTRVRIEGAVESRAPDYPIEALRQLVRNAIMHRLYEGTHAPVRVYWFSDHIEIHSPGGPFGLVSRSNFGQPGVTDYRNPQVAEAMKVLGYVQRFGAGFPIIRRELAANENPDLQFEIDASIVFTVRRRP